MEQDDQDDAQEIPAFWTYLREIKVKNSFIYKFLFNFTQKYFFF